MKKKTLQLCLELVNAQQIPGNHPQIVEVAAILKEARTELEFELSISEEQ